MYTVKAEHIQKDTVVIYQLYCQLENHLLLHKYTMK